MKYEPYASLQALDVFPYVSFTPQWLIDCGPGLGQEAHKFAEKWPNIHVLGVEPSVNIYNWVGGDYPGMLLHAAVWHRDGKELLYNPNSIMGSSLITNNKSDTVVEVNTLTLDTLDRLYGPFEDAVLWADVEGAEVSVLKGGKQVMERGAIKLMNLEVHDGANEEEVDSLCRSLGFEKVHSYAGNGAHHDNIYVRKI